MAQIERVNYDSYIKPLEHIQKAHNDTLADMANMSQQSEILDYYLDPNLDKESYNLYNNFKQEFNNQADDFARNGLTRSNGTKLLNLHRNYNRNVANVIDAVKNREAERAEQHKLFADSNGQVVFGKEQNADYKSVDDYLHGNKGYIFQNLDEVYKYAKNQAAAASKREYKDGVADAVRVLDNNYYKILEETGYNTQAAYEKLDAMMGDVANQMDLTYNPNNDPSIDPKDNPAGLIRNMREELRRRGLENYSNEDKHKIISSFLTGTYEGLGYDPKLTFKETAELRKAGRSSGPVIKIGGDRIEHDDTHVSTNDMLVKSSFKNENASNQEKTYNAMLDGSDKSISNLIVESRFKDPSTGRPLHRLANIDEWMEKYGYKKDNKGNFLFNGKLISKNETESYTLSYIDNNGQLAKRTITVPKEAVKAYNESIRTYVENMYHFTPGLNGKFSTNIQSMLNPYSEEDCIENAIPAQMEQNKLDADSQHYIATRMNINKSDKQAALRETVTGMGDMKIKTGLTPNPKTGTWSFTGQDDGKMRTALLDGKYAEGARISYIYIPQSKKDKNPIWVQIEYPTATNTLIGFVPLDKWSSTSDARTTNDLHNWAMENRNVIQKNAELLGIPETTTIADLNKKIRPAIIKNKKMSYDEKKVAIEALNEMIDAIQYCDLALKKTNIAASMVIKRQELYNK